MFIKSKYNSNAHIIAALSSSRYSAVLFIFATSYAMYIINIIIPIIVIPKSNNCEFTASILIAEFGDINRFNNIKELTAYCGLDPSIKQSGRSIDIHGPISKSGNKYLRKILFVSCLNIVRLSAKCHVQNDIEFYYRKKRNEGKHHYAATIA